MTTVSSPNEHSPRQAVASAMREGSAIGILYSAAIARILGISSSDLECLDFVAMNEKATAGDLARATGLTTGAITGVIDRLEAAGFIKRHSDESDRRKVFIRTTSAFLKKVVPHFGPMGRRQEAVIAEFAEAELLIIAAFMTRSVEAARAALAEIENNKKIRRTQGA